MRLQMKRINASLEMLDKLNEIHNIISLLYSAYLQSAIVFANLENSKNMGKDSPYIGDYIDELHLFYYKCYEHIGSLISLYSKAYTYAHMAIMELIEQDMMLAR